MSRHNLGRALDDAGQFRVVPCHIHAGPCVILRAGRLEAHTSPDKIQQEVESARRTQTNLFPVEKK